MVQGGIFCVAVFLQSAGCGEVRYRDTISPQTSIQKLVLQGDVGVVEVVPSDRTRVEYAVRAPEGTALVQYTEFDGVLQVNTRCRTPILCSVDAEIHIPMDVHLDIELDRGEVWATGVGAINVSVGQGLVDLETASVTTVQVGSGSARVVSRQPEQIRVAVGQGDITALVSPEAWNVSIVAAGESLKGIAHDEDASGILELVAPAGVVSVKAVDGARDSGTP